MVAYAEPHVAPFGRLLTAMVTPMFADGSIDLAGAEALASRLVDQGHDGLVINGTTGESATTSDTEKLELLRTVISAVGDRATILAGVGSYSTAHSIESARAAQSAGADGFLVVTPYYNRPPQAGLVQHFLAIADATELPILTYDIPKRTGTAIELDTFLRIAEHPRIVANKDAKGDLEEVQWVLRQTDLAWYSGDDAINLPLLSIGAVGVVSVTGHVVGPQLRALIDAFVAGDVKAAMQINASILPVNTGIFRTQGVILTKAALNALGLPAGPVRLPLVDATPEQTATLLADLRAGGAEGFTT